MIFENLTFRRTDRSVGSENFYPIHLTNEELQTIINELLEYLCFENSGLIKVFVRKDKGGKGIDLKMEKWVVTPHQHLKDRQYSLGINANWHLVDLFEHYTFGGTLKRVGGKDYLKQQYVAEEINGPQLEETEVIYRERLVKPRPLVLNSMFKHDNWSCVYEQNNILTMGIEAN